MHIPNAIDLLHTEIARLQYALADSQRTVLTLQNEVNALQAVDAAWRRTVVALTGGLHQAATFVDPEPAKETPPPPKQHVMPARALKAPAQQPIGLPSR